MRIADGPVVLVSSPICHQVAVSGSHMRSAVRRNSPLHRQGSAFGPRGCSSRAPHSPICRPRGVLPVPREGEPLISTRLSAPKVTHPDQGGAHRRPRTPQADRPPHPRAGARNALHSQASLVARPISFSVGVSFQDGRRAPPIVPTAQPSHAVQS